MGTRSSLPGNRGLPAFVDPEQFKNLLEKQGVLASVQQGRPCPCYDGRIDQYCEQCGGEGKIYSFKRGLKIFDEDSPFCEDTFTPFYSPLLRVERAEEIFSPEQGGIQQLEVIDQTETTFKINETLHDWTRKRVTYEFDRFESASEFPEVDGWTLRTKSTRFDDGLISSNPLNAHGDVVSATVTQDGHEYQVKETRINEIFLQENGPTPVQGQIHVDYRYVPLSFVAMGALESVMEANEFSRDLESETQAFYVEPWFAPADGDVIVVRSSELTRDEILVPGSTGIDRLQEFEVLEVDSAVDRSGRVYMPHEDFTLAGAREIRWIDRPEGPVSLRYSYRPAYAVYNGPRGPNRLERRQFPALVTARRFNRLSDRDRQYVS